VSDLCPRCGDHPPRSPEEPFCSICIVSIKVEIMRGLALIGRYLERHAQFSDWLAEHAR